MEKFEKEYSPPLGFLFGAYKNNLTVPDDRLFFRDQKARTGEYQTEIDSSKCFLYVEGRRLARIICLKVGQAMDSASKVMSYAGLTADQPSEISLDTVEQAIRVYVSIFLKVAEDTSHSKADQATIVSFLRALGGLCAVSHILFKDALFAANNIQDSSPKYTPEHDVEAENREFQRKFRDLENNFTKAASLTKACELLLPMIYDAIAHAQSSIIMTVHYRKEALSHAMENTRRASKGSLDGREPGASAETDA